MENWKKDGNKNKKKNAQVLEYFKNNPGVPYGPQVYERLSRVEGDIVWSYFKYYRDMGLDRSYQKVAEKFGKSDTHIRYQARTYEWRFRVEEWDKTIDRRKNRQRFERQAQADFQHEQLSKKVLEVVNIEIKKLLERSEKSDFSALEPNELIRFFKEGIRAHRLSLGEPETIQQIEQDTINWQNLSTDELIRLKELLEKAKKPKAE